MVILPFDVLLVVVLAVDANAARVRANRRNYGTVGGDLPKAGRPDNFGRVTG